VTKCAYRRAVFDRVEVGVGVAGRVEWIGVNTATVRRR